MMLTKAQVKAIVKKLQKGKRADDRSSFMSIQMIQGDPRLCWYSSCEVATFELLFCEDLVGKVLHCEPLEEWSVLAKARDRFTLADVRRLAVPAENSLQDLNFAFRSEHKPIGVITLDAERLLDLQVIAGGHMDMYFRGSDSSPVDLVNESTGFKGILLPIRTHREGR